MTSKEINETVTRIENSNTKNEALFGFFQYGGDIYESCIRANKQGLELFAAELLKASARTEIIDFKNEDFTWFEIDSKWTSPDADFNIDGIELTKKLKPKENLLAEYKETWKDKIFGYTIVGIIFLLFSLLVIGFITTIKWLL